MKTLIMRNKLIFPKIRGINEFNYEEYITRGDAAVLTSELLTLRLGSGENLRDVFANRVGGAPTRPPSLRPRLTQTAKTLLLSK